jgi:hypothetical protein
MGQEPKSWKTFLKKSFPNLSKNFNLKPLCGFRKKAPCSFISRDFNVLPFTNTREARGDKGQGQNLGKLF